LKRWITNAGRQGMGPPLAWGIGVAAIASVFAIVVIVANYGPLNSVTEEQLVRMELPSARYDAVSALIKAAGQACPKVCAIRPATTLSGTTALDVECASESAPTGCTAPVHYNIAVTATN
jgi:hypothetical protein